MKKLLLFIIVINISFGIWLAFFQKSNTNTSYTYKVDKGNLVLLDERKN